jgi:hypothetical protein
MAGKRLKCPKCLNRFVVSESDASSMSTLAVPGSADAALTLHDMERRPPSADELPVPSATGDLRETFNLPLVSGREAERGEVASSAAEADASTLFKDEGPSRRRQTAAEGRAKGRRCSHCGGFVPQGMSICATCGTDQETGMRVGLEDDLMPVHAARSQGPPLHVSIVGGICGTAGIIVLLLGVIKSTRGTSNLVNYGWLALALVAAFGIYACVQFIRGKSAKLLMVALALGLACDVVSLIAWPIIHPMIEDQDKIITESKPVDAEDSSVSFKAFEDRMDTERIKLGFGLILVYALLSVYLISPVVKKYIVHSRGERNA